MTLGIESQLMIDEIPAVTRPVVRIMLIRPLGDPLLFARSSGVLAEQPLRRRSEQDRSAVWRPYRVSIKRRCRGEPAGGAAPHVKHPEIVAARSVTRCHNATPVRRKAEREAVG